MSEIAPATDGDRPKSKKELRAEKKAAKKAAMAAATAAKEVPKSADQVKEEKHRLKKERRKQQLQEREKERLKELRREKKLRKQKRKRRELHAVGGGLDPKQAAERLEERRSKKKQKKDQKAATAAKESSSSKAQDMAVFDNLFNGGGDNDDEEGRTLEMGVKAIDIIVGEGEIVQNRSLVAVKYRLTGGKFNALIDSSKNFKFRVGKGEVIAGWDIGVKGMRVGGRRKLIVPPKAGYGGQDIGAGPGARLFFDITVLACN